MASTTQADRRRDWSLVSVSKQQRQDRWRKLTCVLYGLAALCLH